MGTFGFDEEILFAQMVSDHLWVVDWISGTGNEGPGPSNLSEELLAHRDSALRLPFGFLGPLTLSTAIWSAIKILLSNFGQSDVLAT